MSKELQLLKQPPEEILRQRREEAQRLLHDAVLQQKRLIKKGTFDPFVGKSHERLITAYKQSALFSTTYKMGIDEKAKGIDNQAFAQEFCGKMFNDLAFAYVSAQQAKRGNIVLSEKAMLPIIRTLHPDIPEKKYSFDRTSLREIYIPDGTLIDNNGAIIGLMEFTMRRDREIGPKYYRFRNLIKSIKDFAYFPQFIFVTPRNESYHQFANTYEEFSQISLPLWSGAIRSLYDNITRSDTKFHEIG